MWSAVVICLTLIIITVLIVAHRKHWIDDAAFHRYAAVASILGFPLGLIAYLQPAQITTYQPPVPTPTPIAFGTAATTPSPIPSATRTPPTAEPTPPEVNEESIEVERGRTKWAINREVSISVNDVGGDKVTATIGSKDGADLTIKDKGAGFAIIYHGKRTYKIRITAIRSIGSIAEFTVTVIR